MFNSVFGIFGKRGSGKTDFLRGNPQHNIEGVMNVYTKYRDMKVLIIDTIDHPSYRNVPILSPAEFQNWKTGICRIFTDREQIPILNKFLNKSPAAYNTLLVYEDAHKHTKKVIDKYLLQLISDSKQKNIDICFMYHSFVQCPPELLGYLDYLEVFKTKVSPESRKDYMLDYYTEMMQAYKRIKESKNPFYHETVQTDLA